MPKLNPKQINESIVDGYILKTSGDTVLWAPSNGVTGFTYSPTTNTFTIDRDGQSSLSAYLDEVSGLTVTGNIDVQGNLSNSTGLLTIQDDLDVVGDMTLAGDLTILGSATTINIESETVNIADNFILLNSNVTGGTPDQDAGIDVSRGNEPDARLLWNETLDRWEIGISGSTLPIITTATDIHLSGASFSDATNTLTLNMANESDITVTGIVDTFVTAYTYDKTTNTFTISQNESGGDLSAFINEVTGFTVTGDLDVGKNITMYSDDGVTNPTFTYSGTTAGTITMHIEPDGSLIWEGDNGSLFSIVDDKSGILWAASDISGNDIGYIDADWLVQFGDPNDRPFKLIYTASAGTTDLNVNVLDFNITGDTTISSGSTFTYANNPSDGFVLTSDAFGNATWEELIISASSVTGLTLNSLEDVTTGLPVSPTAADDGRMLFYDFDQNLWVSDDTVNHGSVVINARASGSTISKGTPVYLTGLFVDDVHEVGIADADDPSKMPVIGFAAEDVLTTGSKHVITFGKLQGIDTTSGGAISGGESWSAGDILYISKTAGVLTSTRPTGASTQIQRVAQVLRVDASGGQLFIFNTARSAGLPNLTQDNLWIGNSNNQPIEISTTGVGVTTTAFTYTSASNLLTIERSQGFSNLTATINEVSGLTVNGTLTATTLDGGTILSGGTNLNTLFHPKTTGTTNFVPKWDAEGDDLIDSQIYDDGTTVAVNTTSPDAAYTFYVSGNTFVDGNLDATAKSFNIKHPTKEGKRLVHGSLEGPEFGVYYRGKVEGKVIELPDYWRGLVDEDTISVQLTAIGGSQNLYVEVIEDNKIYINCSGWFKKPNCYFTVYGERKDIDRLEIEK